MYRQTHTVQHLTTTSVDTVLFLEHDKFLLSGSQWTKSFDVSTNL